MEGGEAYDRGRKGTREGGLSRRGKGWGGGGGVDGD